MKKSKAKEIGGLLPHSSLRIFFMQRSDLELQVVLLENEFLFSIIFQAKANLLITLAVT